MDNVTCPSDVQVENELQVHQPVEVKSTNDLIVKVQH
jgi:hypothetical protein